jgi:peptidoglycan-N-acetylglucosamine deacetylase
MKWNYAFALIIISTSCLIKNSQDINQQKGGIIFTFDDQYVDEWYSFSDIFLEYNIKATFFINRPQNLIDCQIKKLRQLAEDGHEIGCHGFNHLNAMDFKDNFEMYFSEEVNPAIEILESLGFEIKSFAYPYGSSTEQIDSLLLQRIQYLRKATWNIKDTTIDYYDNIFASTVSYSIINSMGIDNNYGITSDNIEAGIKRAIKNNEVLVLHCHNISTSQNDYSVNPDFLEEVFQLCNKYGLISIRVKDLENFFNYNL